MKTLLIPSEYETERGKPMPSRNHAYIQSKLLKLIDRRYAAVYDVISELSLLLDDKERIPDISIYDHFEFRPGNDEVKVTQIPKAVVEILSPTQHLTDLIIKSYTYFDAGIKSYWLVLPDLRTIYVFSAPNEYEAFVKKGILKDENLQIELDVSEIFQ